MADVKISGMTSATTPLAGTESVELVQGGNTRKATVADLELDTTLAALNTRVTDATLARTDDSQTFTGAQNTGITTLTDAAVILIDAESNGSYKVTLGGARQLDNPTNLAAGMSWTLRVIQDGTGSRALTFDTFYDFGDDNTAVDTSADAASKERLLTFYAVTTTKVLVSDAVGVY